MAKAKEKVTAFSIGKSVAAEKLEFIAPARRGSMYDPIFAEMKKLKAGEAFTVDIPKDVPKAVMHNRMAAAIRRGIVEAPKNCEFVKRTTVDGKIAVVCQNVFKPVAGAKRGKASTKATKTAKTETPAPATAEAK